MNTPRSSLFPFAKLTLLERACNALQTIANGDLQGATPEDYAADMLLILRCDPSWPDPVLSFGGPSSESSDSMEVADGPPEECPRRTGIACEPEPCWCRRPNAEYRP